MIVSISDLLIHLFMNHLVYNLQEFPADFCSQGV